LGIDASVVELEIVWHVGIPCSGSQVADLFVVGLNSPCKVVDVGMGGGELLGGDGGVLLHCGGEPVGHCAHDFTEFVSAEANEGFGRTRG
jgi:hypothetical protein